MNVHSDVLKISASIVQGAEARVHRCDWNAIATELNAQGCAPDLNLAAGLDEALEKSAKILLTN
jgi:hypothetical protein